MQYQGRGGREETDPYIPFAADALQRCPIKALKSLFDWCKSRFGHNKKFTFVFKDVPKDVAIEDPMPRRPCPLMYFATEVGCPIMEAPVMCFIFHKVNTNTK